MYRNAKNYFMVISMKKPFSGNNNYLNFNNEKNIISICGNDLPKYECTTRTP